MEKCKLVIQIPCYNEEKTLPITIKDLPGTIDGVSEIEVLIINDGSTDRTVEVARENGIRHIIDLKDKKGLAVVFAAGLEEALRLGADIIVNTDADNQYRGKDIPRLVRPILEKKADMVIGCRRIEEIKHFSLLKKKLQRLGSRVVKYLSGLDIPDATTGFRAYSREAALKLNILSPFTYTLESIIAAGNRGLAVDTIEVSTNPDSRRSRLFRSMPEYIGRSMATLIRVYTMYKPLKVFLSLGLILFVLGLIPAVRFFYFFARGEGGGHVQSLILSAVLMLIGFQTMLLGMLSDLIAANRRLLENALSKIRKMETEKPVR